MGADGAGEEGRIDWQGGKKEAAGAGGFAIAFDLRFDHGDGFQPRKARLARSAAVAVQPGYIMADPVAADFNASVVGVGGFMHGQGLGLGAVEEQGDLLGEAALVVLAGRKIVGPAGENGLGDLGPVCPWRRW